MALRLNELLKGSKSDIDAIREASQLCENDDELLMLVRSEIYRWTCSAPVFATFKYAKEYADPRMYPNIANLLTIILTQQLTNAEAERLFSNA